ncbi:MAG: hypothetical protein IJE40_03270 [Clostridia bacterium]|nr:hypothetical protein [Clostridia bacterium]
MVLIMSYIIRYSSFVVLFTLILSLYGCEETSSSWVPFEDLPEGYTLEEAKKDNCVVKENGDVTSGKEVWESFLKKTENNEPASVRMVHYYTLGDKERYDESYYESIKNDYPKMYILDFEFDGEKYIWKDYSDEEPRISEYKYLIRYEENDPPESATFESAVYYILVNENTYTLDQIQWSMLSSQSTDWIDFKYTCIEYDYKD